MRTTLNREFREEQEQHYAVLISFSSSGVLARKATKMRYIVMSKASKTDWKRLAAMKDKDIDTSDMPELGDDFFSRPNCACRRRNR